MGDSQERKSGMENQNENQRTHMDTTEIAVISFTPKGQKLAEKIKEKLELSEENICVKVGREPEESLQDWCRRSFLESQALIFVGAVGIAVRTIAPFVEDKFKDPAVLVLDEQGNYVIPILSGHVGGGNEWAAVLAKELPAVPVITTATDLYGKFAVDVFAAKQKLVLSDRVLAKEISAAVLRGEQIGFFCEGRVDGKLPDELIWNYEIRQQEGSAGNCEDRQLEESAGNCEDRQQEGSAGNCEVRYTENRNYQIIVGVHQRMPGENTLYLHPKAIVIGIGCKKGKTLEEIQGFVCRVLEEQQIAMESVCCVASVDQKKEEPGIVEFSRKYQIPFQTFSTCQLAEVPGEFAESKFVKDTVGIGNVCERAAIKAAMEISNVCTGRTEGLPEHAAGKNGSSQLPLLIRKKTAECGITVALAETDWSVGFE